MSIGSTVPPVRLPSTSGGPVDVAVAGRPTILFGYPLGSALPKPDGWQRIPGAIGCTLECRLFAQRYPEIKEKGVQLLGVSTQRSEDQAVFSQTEGVPFPLLSDAELKLRIRRLILLVDADRAITDVLFPVTDVPAAVRWAVDQIS